MPGRVFDLNVLRKRLGLKEVYEVVAASEKKVNTINSYAKSYREQINDISSS